jgi:hypothetical protein
VSDARLTLEHRISQGTVLPLNCQGIDSRLGDVMDCWRMDYNHYRLHSSLDYMAQAAFPATFLEQGSGTLRLPQDQGYSCEILS